MFKNLCSILKISKHCTPKEDYLFLIEALAYPDNIFIGYSITNYLKRVKKYVFLLASNLSQSKVYKKFLTHSYISTLIDAVTVYDLGKSRLPSYILEKKKLSLDDWKIIKEHCFYGAQIINKALAQNPNSFFLQLCLEVVLYHHEHFDGNGYPYGLKGEEIPLSARIVALADVYNALRTNRPYRPAWGHQETLEYILNQKNKIFDPLIVDTFLKLHLQFRDISRELLKDDLLTYEQKYKQQTNIETEHL